MSYTPHDAHFVGEELTPVFTKRTRDPQRGWMTQSYYKGKPSRIALLIGSASSDQRLEHSECGDGMEELTIYTPEPTESGSNPESQDTWELLSNRVEKDLYEHPLAKALTAYEIEAIKGYLQKHPKAQLLPLVYDGTGDVDDPASYDPVTGDALDLFKLQQRGTNKFTDVEYVLRYSVTCSTRSAVVASFTNCGKLFTPTQLGTPATSGVTIPTAIGFSISGIPVRPPPPASAPEGYLWSWMKMAPTVRSAPHGKIVISQEWWLDLWSTWIYDAVT